jgi:arylsulfatase A-like enzyme
LADQNRREFLAQTAAMGGMTFTTQAAGADQAAGNKPPNLVYIFADQLRYFSCGYAGDEYARTPNIDRLAAQGCNFHQAISSTPVCAPYRASLFTGKYQSSTGMVINELRLSPEHECLGHVLTRNKYRTAYIGKWHLWANELGHHEQTRNGFVPPGPYRLGFDGLWQAYNFNHEYYNSPYFENDKNRHIRNQYEPDGQTDVAIRFLEEAGKGNEPFALFVSWGPPHDPWDTNNVRPDDLELFKDVTLPKRPNYSEIPDPYADNWAKIGNQYPKQIDQFQRTYYAQSAGIDRCVGRIMDALNKQGLSDNTILVFTSDHGEMFGAHGRRAKYIFYEEAARIPFLMRWPGRIPAKAVSDAPLGTPDIMPTLLSLMNLPVPKSVEGSDFSGHVLGRSGATPEAAHLQGMGTTAAWTDGTEWRALRDGEYTYAIYHRDRRELLFRNRTDPYQIRDLAGERSSGALLKHYREMSERWRAGQNDTFEACTWYQDRWTRDRNITGTARGIGQDVDALNAMLKRWYPNGEAN